MFVISASFVGLLKMANQSKEKKKTEDQGAQNDEIIQHTGKSFCWKYFGVTRDKTQAVCRQCGVRYAFKGG